MGGASLNDKFELMTSNYGMCRFETQRRHPKSLGRMEQALLDTIQSTTKKKFDGKLEVTDESKEYDVDGFCKVVESGIQQYGFEPLFYGWNSSTSIMINLAKDRHMIGYEEVMVQHQIRLVEPPIATNAAGVETAESKQIRFAAYDEYKRRGISLSHLYL